MPEFSTSISAGRIEERNGYCNRFEGNTSSGAVVVSARGGTRKAEIPIVDEECEAALKREDEIFEVR